MCYWQPTLGSKRARTYTSIYKTVLSVRSKTGTQLSTMLERDLEQAGYQGTAHLLYRKCKDPLPANLEEQ